MIKNSGYSYAYKWEIANQSNIEKNNKTKPELLSYKN